MAENQNEDVGTGDDAIDNFLPPEVSLAGDGIDLQKLTALEATEFEIEEPQEDPDGEFRPKQFDPNYFQFGEEDLYEDGPNDSTFKEFDKQMKSLLEDGGVKKMILTEGVGPVIYEKSYATVDYTAQAPGQDEPLDSTTMRGKPFKFYLGEGETTLGFETAVKSMRKQEEARFLIQPEYYLGKQGCPPRVPANEPILFWIKLVDFCEAGGVESYYRMTAEEKKDVSFELIDKIVKKEKKEGQDFYTRQQYGKAVRHYKTAVKVLEDYHLKNDEEETEQQKALVKLHNNVALCQWKAKFHHDSMRHANDALRIEPNNIKALYYLGCNKMDLSEFEDAKRLLLKAQKLDPQNSDISKQLSNLDRKRTQFAEMESNMYKRMFNNTTSANGKTSGKTETNKENNSSAPNVAVEDVTEEFKKLMLERLQSFKDSPNTEMPLPPNISQEESTAITNMAKNLGLTVESRSADCQRIVKSTPP